MDISPSARTASASAQRSTPGFLQRCNALAHHCFAGARISKQRDKRLAVRLCDAMGAVMATMSVVTIGDRLDDFR